MERLLTAILAFRSAEARACHELRWADEARVPTEAAMWFDAMDGLGASRLAPVVLG